MHQPTACLPCSAQALRELQRPDTDPATVRAKPAITWQPVSVQTGAGPAAVAVVPVCLDHLDSGQPSGLLVARG